MISWSGESMPVHGPTWYSHWPGMTSPLMPEMLMPASESSRADGGERMEGGEQRGGGAKTEDEIVERGGGRRPEHEPTNWTGCS